MRMMMMVMMTMRMVMMVMMTMIMMMMTRHFELSAVLMLRNLFSKAVPSEVGLEASCDPL